MGSVEWQKVRIPLLERLALLELAEGRGESEEETLKRIIRGAVRAECMRPKHRQTECKSEVQAANPETAAGY